MPDHVLRPLGPDDLDDAFRLGGLAFGGDPAATRSERPGRRELGAFDGGRLVAKVAVHDYEQWWGGRPVRMGGLSGVAAHPEVRGQGLVRRLVGLADDDMRERGQVVSALYPTASGIYRSMGWELVGTLSETRLPLTALPTGGAAAVRAATPEDLPAIAAVYDAWGRVRSGLLTRTGPCFPKGPAGLLEHDVVTVAEVDGLVVGYVAYARGRGMGRDAELRVSELVTADPEACSALLGSLRSWGSVVGGVSFRGTTDELGLAVTDTLPPPHEHKPWMLRLVDVPGAFAARGWPVDGVASWETAGTAWRLEVSAGQGLLEPVSSTGLPVVHPRGLAVLWSGASSSPSLCRAGLADRPVPALDALCAGDAPTILDYF